MCKVEKVEDVQQWEYHIESLGRKSRLETGQEFAKEVTNIIGWLNEHGAVGWELLNIIFVEDSALGLLRRPLVEGIAEWQEEVWQARAEARSKARH